MRILMLSANPAVKSPLPKHTPWLVQALTELGCEIVLQPWGRHSDDEGLREKVIGRWQDILRVRRILGSAPFDALVVKTGHDWSSFMRDVPLLLATRRTRPATIMQFHGSQPNYLLGGGRYLFKLASALLMRLCDAVLLLSTEELRQWEEFYPAGKFYVVSNPFVHQVPRPATIPAPLLDMPPEVPVLMFAGRLFPDKGILDLVDAMARLAPRESCHLLVAGDGVLFRQVRERVGALELEEYVTMAGYLTADELASAYQRATIFVLPTYYQEGFPTVIAEAMGAGLPIVTTRIRGAADYLEEKVHALFVPPRDPVTLADTLARLLADPALQARMSQANLEKVKEFAPAVVGARYFAALEQVVRTA